MYAKITTTITTLIDLETFEPDHSVDIEAEDALPENLIYAAVVGACKTTIGSVEKKISVESSYPEISDDEY